MARKQRSGAQNRKRARERAKLQGVLMPQPAPLAELSSLTGIIREKGRNYRNWRLGKIPHEQYLIAIRGLSALAAALSAREAERQREIDEQVVRALEAHEARLAGAPLVELPAAGPSLVGEYIPRETSEENT